MINVTVVRCVTSVTDQFLIRLGLFVASTRPSPSLDSDDSFLSAILMVALISRGSLISFWTFAFVLLLSSNYYNSASMPHCVKDCNRTFADVAALSRHQKACPIMKVVRRRSQDIRKSKGIGRSIQDTSTSLLTRKQRLQVGDCSAFNLKVFYLQYSGTSKQDKC